MGFAVEKNPRRVQLLFEKTDGQMIPVRDVEIVDIVCGANHTVRATRVQSLFHTDGSPDIIGRGFVACDLSDFDQNQS